MSRLDRVVSCGAPDYVGGGGAGASPRPSRFQVRSAKPLYATRPAGLLNELKYRCRQGAASRWRKAKDPEGRMRKERSTSVAENERETSQSELSIVQVQGEAVWTRRWGASRDCSFVGSQNSPGKRSRKVTSMVRGVAPSPNGLSVPQQTVQLSPSSFGGSGVPIVVIATVERTVKTFPIVLPTFRYESDELTIVDYFFAGRIEREEFFGVNVGEFLDLRTLIRSALLKAFPKASDRRVKFFFDVDEKEVRDLCPFSSIVKRSWFEYESASRAPTTADTFSLCCVVNFHGTLEIDCSDISRRCCVPSDLVRAALNVFNCADVNDIRISCNFVP